MSRERTGAVEVSGEFLHSLAGYQPRRAERRERRLAIRLPLLVSGFGADGRLFQEVAETTDVSHSGCSLRLRRQPQDASPLTVRIVPRSSAAPQEHALFEVEWCRREGDGWAVGASAFCGTDLWTLAFRSRTA